MKSRSARSERALKRAKRIMIQRQLSLGRKFIGPTPKNVIQTIDIGPEKAYRFHGIAKKNPARGYAAIDPEFGRREEYRRTILEKEPLSNLKITASNFEPAFEKLIRQGVKTRHINMDMPNPQPEYPGERMRDPIQRMMNNLCSLSSRLLLPNGKIYITTEISQYLEDITRIAKEFGFSVRVKENFLPKTFVRTKGGKEELSHAYYRSFYVSDKAHDGEPIYRIELTYGLKRAARDKM